MRPIRNQIRLSPLTNSEPTRRSFELASLIPSPATQYRWECAQPSPRSLDLLRLPEPRTKLVCKRQRTPFATELSKTEIVTIPRHVGFLSHAVRGADSLVVSIRLAQQPWPTRVLTPVSPEEATEPFRPSRLLTALYRDHVALPFSLEHRRPDLALSELEELLTDHVEGYFLSVATECANAGLSQLAITLVERAGRPRFTRSACRELTFALQIDTEDPKPVLALLAEEIARFVSDCTRERPWGLLRRSDEGCVLVQPAFRLEVVDLAQLDMGD